MKNFKFVAFILVFTVFGKCTLFAEGTKQVMPTTEKKYADNAFVENTEKKVITYFDKFSYTFDENTSWAIVNPVYYTTIKSGAGPIKDFSFPSPGIYNIEVFEETSHIQGDCNHSHYPKKIVIEVSPMKMEFDFSSVKFNNEIIGGQSQDENLITIDVYFSNTKNESVDFGSGQLATAGIGTTIQGELVNKKTILSPGVNHLVYKLTGYATSDTFIMFEFSDINKQTSNYYFPAKIK
jgi:hypothetical protein